MVESCAQQHVCKVPDPLNVLHQVPATKSEELHVEGVLQGHPPRAGEKAGGRTPRNFWRDSTKVYSICTLGLRLELRLGLTNAHVVEGDCKYIPRIFYYTLGPLGGNPIDQKTDYG